MIISVRVGKRGSKEDNVSIHTSKAAAEAASDVPLCGMISKRGIMGTGEK